jgi:hypothetical protein
MEYAVFIENFNIYSKRWVNAFCLTKKHHFAGRVSVEPNSAIFGTSAFKA